MDLATLIAQLAAIPHVGPFVVYLPLICTIAVTVCSFLATKLPAPTVTRGRYFWLYTIVNLVAMSRGHAVNLSAPSSAGIVGGPSAIIAPQVAVQSVPKMPTLLLILILLPLLTGCIVPLGHRAGHWHPDPLWGDRGLRRY